MAGCRLLWLLSVGQATESNSPTGENERNLNAQVIELALIQNLFQQNNPVNLPQPKRRFSQLAPF
jgi:hypothetical protein